MEISVDERVAVAKNLVGAVAVPPAFIDDDVMNECQRLGYVAPRLPAPNEDTTGACIATRGDGVVFVIEVASAGKAFMAAIMTAPKPRLAVASGFGRCTNLLPHACTGDATCWSAPS